MHYTCIVIWLVHVCCVYEVTLNLTAEIFHTYLQTFCLFRAVLILCFLTVVQLFYLFPCFLSLINVDSLPLATFRKPSKAAHYRCLHSSKVFVKLLVQSTFFDLTKSAFFLFSILEWEWLVQNAIATFCSFRPWEQNGWHGVLSIPEYECGMKERAHFTFWPFSFQNCE